LGRTALEISRLGLGTSPFGGSFGPADEFDCRDCLQRALDVGINYFDTSPYYGRTRSEFVLGRCLRGIPRDRYILSTKVGRYGDRPEDFDFSADRVRQSVDESLERLGVDHVDVVLCHDIEHGSVTQVVDEAIPALRDVVRQGKARVSPEVVGILDRLETNAEFWQQRMEKLFATSRLLGSYFATSVERLREVATHRGVHHVDNAVSLASGEAIHRMPFLSLSIVRPLEATLCR